MNPEESTQFSMLLALNKPFWKDPAWIILIFIGPKQLLVKIQPLEGLWVDPEDNSICCQAWRSELNPWDLYFGRRILTSAINGGCYTASLACGHQMPRSTPHPPSCPINRNRPWLRVLQIWCLESRSSPRSTVCPAMTLSPEMFLHDGSGISRS